MMTTSLFRLNPAFKILFFIFFTYSANSTSSEILPQFTSNQPPCNKVFDPMFQNITDMSKLLMSPSSDLCAELPIGTFKDIKLYSDDSPTTVKHNYRLTRLSPNHYKVSLKLNFIIPPPFKDNLSNSKMIEKVKSCLKKANRRSFGPNNEFLEFSLYEPSTKEPDLRGNIIAVVSVPIRENSGKWSFDTDCPTLFHELLHLTGLVDEYKEASRGKSFDKTTKKYITVESGSQKSAFDCRKNYDSNSIMRNQSQRFSESFQSHYLITRFCVSSADKIKKYYNDPNYAKFTKCPEDFQLAKVESRVALDEDQAKLFQDGQLKYFGLNIPPESLKEIENSIPIYSLQASENHQSLLDARHFNAIVFPGCYNKNREYYQNSINAYRTSKNHLGEGCLTFPWIKKSYED
jgi:hypothetical protein